MGRILSVDDFQIYAEMVGAFLAKHGHHEVKVLLNPFTIEEVEAFAPDLIVLNLVRKPETFSAGGLTDFFTEVDGAKALRALAPVANARGWPLVVTALGVAERDVPQSCHYQAFVEVPQRLEHLLATVNTLIGARASGQHALPEN